MSVASTKPQNSQETNQETLHMINLQNRPVNNKSVENLDQAIQYQEDSHKFIKEQTNGKLKKLRSIVNYKKTDRLRQIERHSNIKTIKHNEQYPEWRNKSVWSHMDKMAKNKQQIKDKIIKSATIDKIKANYKSPAAAFLMLKIVKPIMKWLNQDLGLGKFFSWLGLDQVFSFWHKKTDNLMDKAGDLAQEAGNNIKDEVNSSLKKYSPQVKSYLHYAIASAESALISNHLANSRQDFARTVVNLANNLPVKPEKQPLMKVLKVEFAQDKNIENTTTWHNFFTKIIKQGYQVKLDINKKLITLTKANKTFTFATLRSGSHIHFAMVEALSGKATAISLIGEPEVDERGLGLEAAYVVSRTASINKILANELGRREKVIATDLDKLNSLTELQYRKNKLMSGYESTEKMLDELKIAGVDYKNKPRLALKRKINNLVNRIQELQAIDHKMAQKMSKEVLLDRNQPEKFIHQFDIKQKDLEDKINKLDHEVARKNLTKAEKIKILKQVERLKIEQDVNIKMMKEYVTHSSPEIISKIEKASDGRFMKIIDKGVNKMGGRKFTIAFATTAVISLALNDQLNSSTAWEVGKGMIPVYGTWLDAKKLFTGHDDHGNILSTRERIMSGVFAGLGAVSDLLFVTAVGSVAGAGLRAGIMGLKGAAKTVTEVGVRKVVGAMAKQTTKKFIKKRGMYAVSAGEKLKVLKQGKGLKAGVKKLAYERLAKADTLLNSVVTVYHSTKELQQVMRAEMEVAKRVRMPWVTEKLGKKLVRVPKIARSAYLYSYPAVMAYDFATTIYDNRKSITNAPQMIEDKISNVFDNLPEHILG